MRSARDSGSRSADLRPVFGAQPVGRQNGARQRNRPTSLLHDLLFLLLISGVLIAQAMFGDL